MTILGLDTSGQTASVACFSNGVLLGEYTLNHKMTHSQTIMPMIEELCKRAEISLSFIDYIAVAAGPGSFTGLRIGAATAKGLALGLAIPIVPVPTLDALAYNVFDTKSIICPIMDARRQQVYTAFYEWKEGRQRKLTEYTAIPIDDVLEQAKAFERQVIFLGDGVAVYCEKIKAEKNFLIAQAHSLCQRAGAVAELASFYVEQGKAVNGRDFAPFYIRKSQAERELDERNAKEIKEIKEGGNSCV